jgi:hypothetical protein
MELNLTIDETTDKGKKVLSFLTDMGISYAPKKITSKDAAFGIGRKATDEEMDEYIGRCMAGELTDLDDLI